MDKQGFTVWVFMGFTGLLGDLDLPCGCHSSSLLRCHGRHGDESFPSQMIWNLEKCFYSIWNFSVVQCSYEKKDGEPINQSIK